MANNPTTPPPQRQTGHPACMATRQLLLEALMARRKQLLCEASHILGSHERAEDVVQDAALRCMISPAITHIRSCPHGFLRRMVRNIALDHWRRAARDEPLPSPQDIAMPSATAEQQLAGRQMLGRVACAVKRLSPHQRHAIIEHRLKARKQSEIAAEMGISPAYVHALIRVAHDRLLTEIIPTTGNPDQGQANGSANLGPHAPSPA